MLNIPLPSFPSLLFDLPYRVAFSPRMRLIQTAHAYDGDFTIADGDDAPRFTHSTYVFAEDNALYFARCAEPYGSYDPDSLTKTRAPLDVFVARSKVKHLTVALDLSPETSHTKYPNLILYADKPDHASANRVCQSLLQEVQVCEMLHANPHPNISEYIGCSVEKEWIVALHFVKYTDNLSERLCRGPAIDSLRILQGIRKGLEHLHNLGLCHNDLKDSNIMLKPDGTPVIIDFDSCQPVGQTLIKGGTWNWGSPVKYSSPANDWACFQQLERLLLRQDDPPVSCLTTLLNFLKRLIKKAKGC